MTTLIWPPPINLRRSKRAKSIRLVINPKQGLQLVYPYFVSQKVAWEFFESRRQWVEQHYHLINIEKKTEAEQLPQEIDLLAIQKKYGIVYRYLPRSFAPKLQAIGNELICCGETTSLSLYQTPLKAWLRLQAENYLTPRLQQLAQKTALSFGRVTYRYQKTLWGSCTSTADISLNVKLLFLPEKLVQYIFIHELCHTRYFDHSRSFWNLVKSYMPDCQGVRKLLKSADEKYLPDWYEIVG